jgi:hypothetical protein
MRGRPGPAHAALERRPERIEGAAPEIGQALLLASSVLRERAQRSRWQAGQVILVAAHGRQHRAVIDPDLEPVAGDRVASPRARGRRVGVPRCEPA